MNDRTIRPETREEQTDIRQTAAEQRREEQAAALHARFDFRDIRPEEAGEAYELELVCFPPNEACTEKQIRERVIAVPDLFLTAIDRENGRMAGYLTGIATDCPDFRDDFFTDVTTHEPEGQNVMLLSLNVRPEYRGQGLARELIAEFRRREEARGRRRLVLTCHDAKVAMYARMGFRDLGLSASVWGGGSWHEMELILNP